MIKRNYEGPFKDYIKDHLELKQAVGYKYDINVEQLKHFDNFIMEKYPDATNLTKEIVLDWCRKKSYENQTTQNSRASIIRQFAKYLDSIGVKAYIIPKGFYPTEPQYIPYIFSNKELKVFFGESDKCHYSCESPYRHKIMPILFRMIYVCGLRPSEGRLLKNGNVNLKDGILTIEKSKKDNSRLVPMPDSLTKRCQIYSKAVHSFSSDDDYFFLALDGKPLTAGNLYKNFRKFLWQAGISHGGRGHGPRIYDFRHSFAVHCLKKWVKESKDLAAYLPVLKTYMGHDSFSDTAYYLRLTADVFPEITIKLETKYPNIIPELLGDYYETN